VCVCVGEEEREREEGRERATLRWGDGGMKALYMNCDTGKTQHCQGVF